MKKKFYFMKLNKEKGKKKTKTNSTINIKFASSIC